MIPFLVEVPHFGIAPVPVARSVDRVMTDVQTNPTPNQPNFEWSKCGDGTNDPWYRQASELSPQVEAFEANGREGSLFAVFRYADGGPKGLGIVMVANKDGRKLLVSAGHVIDTNRLTFGGVVNLISPDGWCGWTYINDFKRSLPVALRGEGLGTDTQFVAARIKVSGVTPVGHEMVMSENLPDMVNAYYWDHIVGKRVDIKLNRVGMGALWEGVLTDTICPGQSGTGVFESEDDRLMALISGFSGYEIDGDPLLVGKVKCFGKDSTINVVGFLSGVMGK